MKVLFLSVPTGHGHHMAARALEECFKSGRYAGQKIECMTLDVFEHVNPILADSVQKGYLLSTKMTPKAYGAFYSFSEKRDPSKYSSVGKLVKTILNKKLFQFLNEYDPDAIVATHTFSAIAISYLREKYGMHAKSFAIITDFTVHPFWEDVHIDYYVTASELLNWQAMKKGYSLEKVKPFGIPILSKFAHTIPKAQARRELGLCDRFTVLVMTGSMGYGSDVLANLAKLNDMDEDFQLITVCGNNKKLKAHIDGMEKKKPFLNYGFTDNINLLMDAADCIITKPGGLSTSEALAKRLPIIMLDPIPGQEDRNEEFMLNNGIALSVSKTFPVDEVLYQLIHHPWKLEMLRHNMSYFAKPNSAQDFADFIVKEVNGE